MANKSKPKVYLDTTCFIDAAQHQVGVSQNKEIEDQVWHYKKLLEASRAGDIEVFTSVLTVAEALCIRDNDNKKVHTEEVQRLFKGLLTSGKGGVSLVQPHLRIALRARDFKWKDGINLKPYDSVHLASALDRQCSEFITTDTDFLNISDALYQLGIKPVLAPNSLTLPDKYRMQSMVEVDGFVNGGEGKEVDENEEPKMAGERTVSAGGTAFRDSSENAPEHTLEEEAPLPEPQPAQS